MSVTALSQQGVRDGRVAWPMRITGILGAGKNDSFVPAHTAGGEVGRELLAWTGRMRQAQICVPISILRASPDFSKT